MIVSTLTSLALHIPIEDLLIPPSAYYTDRRKSPDIFAPYASGKRAFGVKSPLPLAADGSARLPRVLRETTSFLLTDSLLNTDGIFRVGARAQTVEVLKEAYDRGQKFLIFKDRNSILTFPQYKEGAGMVTVDELDLREGYDVHSAAAIIKLWYHELRKPIFPPSSYQALEKFYSNSAVPSTEHLQSILSPGVEFSPLPEISAKILKGHLLPLLSMVAERSEFNRMTPQNLAVVFAPNLVCGPDPMEDVKILAIVQPLLRAMITSWKSHLAPALEHTDQMFEESISLPPTIFDREDPLEEMRTEDKADPSSSHANDGSDQINGIALLDNDRNMNESLSDEDTIEDEGVRPPLPPRPVRMQTSGSLDQGLGPPSPIRRKPTPSDAEIPRQYHSPTSTAAASTEQLPMEGALRRKPAPPTASLPRYSLLYGPAVQAALEQYDRNSGLGSTPENDVADVPESHRSEDLPTYEQSTPLYEGPQPPMTESDNLRADQTRPPTGSEKIPRKPVGEGEGKGGG